MKINFTSFLVTEGLIYAAIVAALVNSALRIANGSITIAQALTVLMLSYSYFSSIQQLMSASHGALTAISAAGKVEEILEMDTSRAYDPSLPADPEDFEGIRMEQVSYGYEGRERALTDISLRIPKGSVAALVGLSGCGKSTILPAASSVLCANGGRDPHQWDSTGKNQFPGASSAHYFSGAAPSPAVTGS